MRKIMLSPAPQRFRPIGIQRVGPSRAHRIRLDARNDGRNASAGRRGQGLRQATQRHLHAIELDVASQESVNAAIAEIFPETTSSMWWCIVPTIRPTDRRRPSRQSSWPSFRYQRPGRAAGQSRRPAAVAQAGPRPAGVGFLQRYARWHPALSGSLFRAKRDGRPRGQLCRRLARWGIETTIIVLDPSPGNHYYAHSGRPADAVRAEEYARWPDR